MEPDLLWLILLLPFLLYVLSNVVPRILKRYPSKTPVNPIAEANVYLAYGRKEQAIEILKNALAAAPDNIEIQAKLQGLEKK